MKQDLATGDGLTRTAAIECSGVRRRAARPGEILRRLLADRAGATAIEYGILAVLIAVGVMTVVQSLGDTENESFATLSTGLNTDPPAAVPPFANKPRPAPSPWAPGGGADGPPQMAAPLRPGAPPTVPIDGGGLPGAALDPAAPATVAADSGGPAGSGTSGSGTSGSGSGADGASAGVSGAVTGQTAADQLIVNASTPSPPSQ